MDRFELNWPGADASFYTDGWRCRIVWRQKGRRGGGAMGGTIDNNQQCLKRAAESLEGAPYLLSALKARGHTRLADQIESAASAMPGLSARTGKAAARAPMRTQQVERRRDVENRSAPKRVERNEERVEKPQPLPAANKKAVRKQAEERTSATGETWLERLEGDSAYEVAADKRAKTWLDLGVVSGEALLLKAPAGRGRSDWVLKRTWPDDSERKAEYVVAGSFKGIVSFLVGAGIEARDIERMFGALADASHPELVAAAKAWRAAGQTH